MCLIQDPRSEKFFSNKKNGVCIFGVLGGGGGGGLVGVGLFFLTFVGLLPLLCTGIFIFLVTIYLSVYIHSFIHHSFTTFVESHLHIFTAAGSVGGTSMGCRAEIRTLVCFSASQCTTVPSELSWDYLSWSHPKNRPSKKDILVDLQKLSVCVTSKAFC